MALEAVRAGKPWTQSEDERLLELDEAGATRERMAMELGRSINSVDSRLHELRQEINQSTVCRNCAYYGPAGLWCYEWNQSTTPDAACKRFVSAKGEASEVRTYRLEEVESTVKRENGGVIWFDPKRSGPGHQGRFVTLQKGRSARLWMSAELVRLLQDRGLRAMRCRIGALVQQREIWIRIEDEGPFLATVDGRPHQKPVGGFGLAENMRVAGMPTGRYYLDEQRSDGTTLILIYQAKEVQAS